MSRLQLPSAESAARAPASKTSRRPQVLHLRVGHDPAVHGSVLAAIWYLRGSGIHEQFAVDQDPYGLFSRSNVRVGDTSDWVLDVSDISDAHREHIRRAMESAQLESVNRALMNTRIDRSMVRLPSVPLTVAVWLMVYEFASAQFPPFHLYQDQAHLVSWAIDHNAIRAVRKDRSLPDPFVLHVMGSTTDPAVRSACPLPVVDLSAADADPNHILAMACDKRCIASISYTDCAMNPLLQQFSSVHYQVLVPSVDRYHDPRCRVTLPPSSANASIYEQAFSVL